MNGLMKSNVFGVIPDYEMKFRVLADKSGIHSDSDLF